MRTKASRDATLRLVGELYYLRGMGLKDVAAVIGQSTATVSRMLQEARDRGIVRIEVVPDTFTRKRSSVRVRYRPPLVMRGS